MRMRLALIFPLAISLAAQDPEFNIESRLVLVPVTVSDTKGRAIDGLEASDFLIYDNGVRQRAVVDTLGTGVAPIALVIAVQSSGISAPVLAKVQKIGGMIQPLITGERGCAAVVAFDEWVQWRQECTNDPDALSRAFYSLQPGAQKSARMLDAVHEAVEKLRSRPNARRVVLLISETRDRGSESELESVVIAAQAAGVSVYTCSYSAFKTAFTTTISKNETPPEPKMPRANRTEPLSARGRIPIPPPDSRVDILGGIGELTRLGKTNDTEVLTKATGGMTFPFTRQKGLEDAIARLGAELHSQYVLSFTPETPAPGYHRLEIKVTRPGEFQLRARPGYWSIR
jgi:VWFA-related protein